MKKLRKLGHAQEAVLQWYKENPGPHTRQEAFEGHKYMSGDELSLVRRGLLTQLPDGRFEYLTEN